MERRAAAGSGLCVAILVLGACYEPPDRNFYDAGGGRPAMNSGAAGAAGNAAAPPIAGRGPDAAARRDAPVRRDAPARRDAGGRPDFGASYPYGAPCNTVDFVPTKILLPKCGGCHNTRSSNLTNFEVTRPGVRQRLSTIAKTCLGNRVLVINNPLGGYMIEKLTSAPGICGSRMPAVGPPLPADEIECVKTWLRSTR